MKIKHNCKQCGQCCRWEGYIYVNHAELSDVAVFLKITEEEFIDRYVELEQKPRFNLKLKENGECLFLNSNNKCDIYSVRPRQCRDFPQLWRIENFDELCPGVEEAEEKGVRVK